MEFRLKLGDTMSNLERFGIKPLEIPSPFSLGPGSCGFPERREGETDYDYKKRLEKDFPELKKLMDDKTFTLNQNGTPSFQTPEGVAAFLKLYPDAQINGNFEDKGVAKRALRDLDKLGVLGNLITASIGRDEIYKGPDLVTLVKQILSPTLNPFDIKGGPRPTQLL